jgi:hypothetical protein
MSVFFRTKQDSAVAGNMGVAGPATTTSVSLDATQRGWEACLRTCDLGIDFAKPGKPENLYNSCNLF